MKPVVLLFAAAACGTSFPPKSDASVVDVCNGAITTVPIAASPHVVEGTNITWTSNPPTSGPHFPVWARWDRHYTSLARGHWLHNIEHGAVVFAYRCDGGCPDVVAALTAVVGSLPLDPLCDAPVRHRAIIVADPLLPADGDIAAAAWGQYYTGTCVDAAALTSFYARAHGRAIEQTCAEGTSLLGGEPL